MTKRTALMNYLEENLEAFLYDNDLLLADRICQIMSNNYPCPRGGENHRKNDCLECYSEFLEQTFQKEKLVNVEELLQ